MYAGPHGVLDGKSYTFKIPKDHNYAVDDWIIVPAANVRDCPYALCLVTSIDEEPDIDLNVPFNYKHVVGKVDTSVYDSLVEKDNASYKEVRKKQKTALRQQMLAMLNDNPMALETRNGK